MSSMKLSDIKNALLTVVPDVFHYYARNKPDKYIVWAEDGQSDELLGDDCMVEQEIQGTIDYFTKTEYDPNFAKIQQALNGIDIAWRLNSIQYEEETGYIHYEWVFEVVLDG